MTTFPVDHPELHRAFLAAPRDQVLMITNHGIHQWEIMPGLPDTGGQNVFVNRVSDELAALGFKVTIVNRGGYPHPVTGEPRRGLRYKDAHRRILYLEDGLAEFVRKEDMAPRIPALTAALENFLAAEGQPVAMLLSHYWDGLAIAVRLNRTLPRRVMHVWTPHSLGAIKKRNVAPERWARLRIAERIAIESEMLPETDGVAATSATIRRSLVEDYGYDGRILFLPPCVDTETFHPRPVPDDDPLWEFLSRRSGLPEDEIRRRRIIAEVSRTDTTKRKDVLLRAFAAIRDRFPDTLLVFSLDDTKRELAVRLRRLMDSLGLRDCVAAYIPDEILPSLYAAAAVYCTPSVMEGFGMSAQEAAATGVPVVASHLVPFVTEYLLGDEAEERECDGHAVRLGRAAVVVPADDVAGFACALGLLLGDEPLRARMGEAAYRITIPYFTWPSRVRAFVDEIG